MSGVTTLFATFYMFGLIVFELIQNPDGMTVQQPVIAEAYYSAVTRGQVIIVFPLGGDDHPLCRYTLHSESSVACASRPVRSGL